LSAPLSFKEELKKAFAPCGFQPSSLQIDSFFKYYNFLNETNKKINLTAITNVTDVIYKHFLDSVIPAKYIPLCSSVVDIGSGAGFPGIPLKIMREDLYITLVESIKKKATFLNSAIDLLSLNKVTVIPERIEVLGQNDIHREKFDIVLARALAPLNVLLEYALPLLKLGGKFIAYKGPNYIEEFTAGSKAAETLGATFIKAEEYPLSDASRVILIYEKTSGTPEMYPRDTKLILKKPLA
jgi:16S rRNA (guanine527-N7)-methyltransferase